MSNDVCQYLLLIEDLETNTWSVFGRYSSLEDATSMFCYNIEPLKKCGHRVKFYIAKAFCNVELV